MDTDSFILHIRTEDFYEDITNDVKKCFDISNYSEDDKRPLSNGMNKSLIGLFKDELWGKVITEFVALRPKTYCYLVDDGDSNEKAKGTKNCVIKRIFEFNDYKDCLFKTGITIQPQSFTQKELKRLH